MTLHPDIIGCDVSKAHLDFFVTSHACARRIDNTSEAISTFLADLKRPADLIVFEATGRYDRPLRQVLEARGLRYARVNPARARHFAKAIGLLAKTDRIDARMLATMGQNLPLAPTPPRAPGRARFAALHGRRDQLVAMRQKERQRLRDADTIERDSLQRHIAWLSEEISAVEKSCERLIKENEALQAKICLLRSIPGIGPVAAAALMVHLPEIGTLSAKQAAALAGLAPFNTDSGRFKGKRSIRGGRKRVRDALYMSAVTAARSAPRFTAWADSLSDNGKPFKVIMIALARKILTIANAVIRDQTPFRAA
jgi:transposase